ncbi:hypothetical protein GCM10022215_10100 [Nocardioides fonticola]|uniref:Uncharacterized protein n=1 Tax=Nocardioides fonticola TaxID=450363 RepID=A0ABP7XE23_9ACTN
MAVYRLPADPPSRRRWGLVLGGPVSWWIHPFEGRTELATLLGAEPERREEFADRAAARDGLHPRDVIALAPLPAHQPAPVTAPGAGAPRVPGSGAPETPDGGELRCRLRVVPVVPGTAGGPVAAGDVRAVALSVAWRLGALTIARTTAPWVVTAEDLDLLPVARIGVRMRINHRPVASLPAPLVVEVTPHGVRTRGPVTPRLRPGDLVEIATEPFGVLRQPVPMPSAVTLAR